MHHDSVFAAHQDILRRSEIVSLPTLCGSIEAMYAIYDQCRIELTGQHGCDESGQPLWEYAVSMPIMCLSTAQVARTEVHFSARLATPLTEEKMRFGCLLQADCEVFPLFASPVSQGRYRITYDAHISLYASCHPCCALNMVS